MALRNTTSKTTLSNNINLSKYKYASIINNETYHINDETIVIVNFIDYMSGRPVASCRGAYGLGFDRARDLKGAIKRVTKQISETFYK